jgi:hypothetical protein
VGLRPQRRASAEPLSAAQHWYFVAGTFPPVALDGWFALYGAIHNDQDAELVLDGAWDAHRTELAGEAKRYGLRPAGVSGVPPTGNVAGLRQWMRDLLDRQWPQHVKRDLDRTLDRAWQDVERTPR